MIERLKRKSVDKVIEDNLDYLVRFAYFRIGDFDEAEDIVYEAVLRLLERDVARINPSGIRLYLFRIVHNMCSDRVRLQLRDTIPLDGVDLVDTEPETDADEFARINSFLDRLPQREADVIRMNVVDEMSFVEISDVLSIPASTAKSRYKSGMDKLRKMIRKR